MESQEIFPSNIWKDISINVNKNNQTYFKKVEEEKDNVKSRWKLENLKTVSTSLRIMRICVSINQQQEATQKRNSENKKEILEMKM